MNACQPNPMLVGGMNNNSNISIGDSGLTIKQRAPPMKVCVQQA
jgi:hypothetical protein